MVLHLAVSRQKTEFDFLNIKMNIYIYENMCDIYITYDILLYTFEDFKIQNESSYTTKKNLLCLLVPCQLDIKQSFK